MNIITVGGGETVIAPPGGEHRFQGGDAASTVALNGNPHDFEFSGEADEGMVLTAVNGSGRYEIGASIGSVRFLSGAIVARHLLPRINGPENALEHRGLLRASTPVRSYAQIQEDVLLWRALRGVDPSEGFYIDVGAHDPDADSATRLFYEIGWRGVNIEPMDEAIARFRAARPRDVNILAAASDRTGTASFFLNGGGQLATLDERFALDDAEAARTVGTVTLADVCQAYAPGDIHFLKIDVEGHEQAVLEGMDFARYRPWILVIEAVAPNERETVTFGEWEPIVDRARYLFAGFDELNRYYVAAERAELLRFFTIPADYYVLTRAIPDAPEPPRGLGARLRALFAA